MSASTITRHTESLVQVVIGTSDLGCRQCYLWIYILYISRRLDDSDSFYRQYWKVMYDILAPRTSGHICIRHIACYCSRCYRTSTSYQLATPIITPSPPPASSKPSRMARCTLNPTTKAHQHIKPNHRCPTQGTD